MDLRRDPTMESRKVSISITGALVSAFHEWLLILLLFIDASFVFVVTRFARCCHLQIPCLLCSRLDHILGREKPDFVWDLMCREHKLKISSLFFCRIHKKLVDVHATCESCFFSFATMNKSNSETYRLLVGKLGDGPRYELDEDTLPADYNNGSCNMRKCCCCNEKWIVKTPGQMLFCNKNADAEKPDLDSPLIPAAYWSNNELLEVKEGALQSEHEHPVTDPLCHVYEKVKVTSDTESESQISDGETASTLVREIDTSEQDSIAVDELPPPQSTTTDVYIDSDKLIHQESDYYVISVHKDKSEAPIVQGLEEIECGEADTRNDVILPSDLISFTESLPSPTTRGTRFDKIKETDSVNTMELEKAVIDGCGEVSKIENVSTGKTEMGKEVVLEPGQNSFPRSYSVQERETQLDPKPISDTGSQLADSLDLGDAFRLAIDTKGRQLSGKFLERQTTMQESNRASEDLKILLSQISASRGVDLSFNDISPRVQANNEDYVSMDASSSTGVQMLHRRISLERNESILYNDGSIITEIEGESILDRMKRQVEQDKKIMGALYKELEEERNAAAVAANQAMAMITRLQEEKATIHMEALQYLRLMEEQAEYDSEAFQKVNDLLVEKEKQIQDMELELEQSKNTIKESNNSLEESSIYEAGKSMAWDREKLHIENPMSSLQCSDDNDYDVVHRTAGKISQQQFDSNRNYILKSLKELEEKLYELSKNEVDQDMSTDDSTATHGTDTSGVEMLDGLRHSKEDGCGIGNNHINSTESKLNVIRYELSAISKKLETLERNQCFVESSNN